MIKWASSLDDLEIAFVEQYRENHKKEDQDQGRWQSEMKMIT